MDTGFDNAMPTLDDFSTLLMNCDYTKWREIADCLKIPKVTLTRISDNLEDNKFRDKKAFLRVLASWRVKAPITIQDRKANWGNLKKAMAGFDDVTEAIEKVQQGYSIRCSENAGFHLCRCGKPLALGILTKNSAAKSLCVYCPKRKDQCKDTFDIADRLFTSKMSCKVSSAFEQLRRILHMERNMELVNFTTLTPHLYKEGLLTDTEYQDLTQRLGVSPQQYFKIFVTEFLLKHSKGNIVNKFVTALKNENEHSGHKDLLKRIEEDKTLKKEIDKEDERADGPSSQKIPREKKEIFLKKKERADGLSSQKRCRESEEKEGPSKKKKRADDPLSQKRFGESERKKVLQIRKNAL